MELAEILPAALNWMLTHLPGLVTAGAVLALGLYASGLIARLMRDWLHVAPGLDETIAPFLAELARYAVLALTITMVLAQFGVQTASILAVLGAIGLAVALALQGTLSNMAAGLMLLWLRPFNAGDYIDANGISGSVRYIGLFGTRLRTYDGVAIFAPNSRLWDAKIINYTREPTRMIEMRLSISYETNIERARAVLLAAADDPRLLSEPAPLVVVVALGASGVDLMLRCWVKSTDWWDARHAVLERAKLALDAGGIEIPYNHLDVKILGPLSPTTPAA